MSNSLVTRSHLTALISEIKHSNLQGTEFVSWTFTNRDERTEVTRFTSETIIIFDMDVNVSAGVSEIVLIEAGFHWEVGVSQSTTASSLTTITLEWGLLGVL